MKKKNLVESGEKEGGEVEKERGRMVEEMMSRRLLGEKKREKKGKEVKML